jgi:shikimate dehydrogenase
MEAARELMALSIELGLPVEVGEWPPSKAAMAADLVVCTVPSAGSQSLIDRVPDDPRCLIDVVYDPWPSPLAAAWIAGGGHVIGGLELLVHQAVEQLEIMTGRRVDPAVLRTAGMAELERRAIAQAEQ